MFSLVHPPLVCMICQLRANSVHIKAIENQSRPVYVLKKQYVHSSTWPKLSTFDLYLYLV